MKTPTRPSGYISPACEAETPWQSLGIAWFLSIVADLLNSYLGRVDWREMGDR